MYNFTLQPTPQMKSLIRKLWNEKQVLVDSRLLQLDIRAAVIIKEASCCSSIPSDQQLSQDQEQDKMIKDKEWIMLVRKYFYHENE